MIGVPLQLLLFSYFTQVGASVPSSNVPIPSIGSHVSQSQHQGSSVSSQKSSQFIPTSSHHEMYSSLAPSMQSSALQPSYFMATQRKASMQTFTSLTTQANSRNTADLVTWYATSTDVLPTPLLHPSQPKSLASTANISPIRTSMLHNQTHTSTNTHSSHHNIASQQKLISSTISPSSAIGGLKATGLGAVPTPISAAIPTRVPHRGLTTMGSVSLAGESCRRILKSLPTDIKFNETEQPGFVLASTKKAANVSMSLSGPHKSILVDYFNISQTFDEFRLTLVERVDVEDVFIQTGRDHLAPDMAGVRVVLDVECKETTISSTKIKISRAAINVTALDVDDSLPIFQHQGTPGACAVPIYKADAEESFMGELTISPGQIEAVDGDLFDTHNISYGVMHANPENYDVYFSLDTTNGKVNKTKAMTAKDPRKYVLFVQAVEDSAQRKTSIAVLSIEVFAPTSHLDLKPSVDSWVRMVLWIVSACILLAFCTGLTIIIHHRSNYKSAEEPKAKDTSLVTVLEDVIVPIIEEEKPVAVEERDVPIVTSPSQVKVAEWKGKNVPSFSISSKTPSWNSVYRGPANKASTSKHPSNKVAQTPRKR